MEDGATAYPNEDVSEIYTCRVKTCWLGPKVIMEFPLGPEFLFDSCL
jgi:hypothetical protein